MNRTIKYTLKKWRYKTRTIAFSIYARIKHHIRIWNFLNRHSISLFKHNQPILDAVQKRILVDLNQDGIAITSLEKLYPKEDRLTELQNYIKKKESRAKVNHKKKFLIDYLPEIPEVGIEIPFFRLAISPRIIDIVNSYMGMYSMMYHFMIRQTLVRHDHACHHSQNWHRTPQEKKVCKVYIYLNDVEEGSGPFTYVPQSTYNKKWGHIFPQESLEGSYLKTEDVEKIIPKKERVAFTGKAGTVIFCDTTGLHRGGLSVDNIRTMSTFAYGAPTYRENIHYSFTEKLFTDLKEYPEQSRFVLNKKWMRKKH